MSRPGFTVDCGDRGCMCGETTTAHDALTIPNAVTLGRTAIALTLALVAVTTGQIMWLYAGLAVYLVLDVADGALARHWHWETRTGAVLDILTDRLCVAAFYLPYVMWHHAMALPAGLFLFQFFALDQYLSLAFLDFAIMSPNYFGLIDTTLYRLNWSRPGKAVNTGLVTATMLLTGSAVAATAAVAVVIAIKLASIHRLQVVVWPQRPAMCHHDEDPLSSPYQRRPYSHFTPFPAGSDKVNP